MMSTVFPYLPRGKWSTPEAPQPRADLISPMAETPGTGSHPGSLDAAGPSAQCHILFDRCLARTWVAPASAGARAAKATGRATKNDPASQGQVGQPHVVLKASFTHRLKPMPPKLPNEKYVALRHECLRHTLPRSARLRGSH
jgi:hypothetical protein